jgi:hypothetical protein
MQKEKARSKGLGRLGTEIARRKTMNCRIFPPIALTCLFPVGLYSIPCYEEVRKA